MGGEDVVESVVGVGSVEVESFEEALEFVDAEPGFDESGEFECVEASGFGEGGAEGALYVVEEDVPVEFDVVSYEGPVAAVVEEALESVSAGEAVAFEVDGEHWIVVAADEGW